MSLFLIIFSSRQPVTLDTGKFRLGAPVVAASAGVSEWRSQRFGVGGLFLISVSTRQKVTLESGKFRLGAPVVAASVSVFLAVRRLPWALASSGAPVGGGEGSFLEPCVGGLFLAVQVGGFARPSSWWCLGVARGAFWSLVGPGFFFFTGQKIT